MNNICAIKFSTSLTHYLPLLSNYFQYKVIISDRPKQEPKPNFGYHSSFGRNRNIKEIEIYVFIHYKKVTNKL